MDGVTSMDSNGAIAPERTRPGVPMAGLPRHDNDRCNITGIHIMPTYGEITSGAGQYLPAADPASWHLPGASGRIDREFRLLREDNVGQIRDACHELLQAAYGPGIEAYRRQRTSTYFDFCEDAKIQHITVSKKHGIQFTVAVKQPASIRNVTDEQRLAWWVRCKRFRPGTIICVLDKAGMILYFVVSDFTLRGPEDAPDDFPMDKKKFNLSSDREWSYVNLELDRSSKLSDALLWYSDTKRTRYLLDFAELKLDSFRHTLAALQWQCQTSHHLVDLLNPLDRPVVQRPAYGRRPGFLFNLDCLMPGGRTFRFDPSHTPIDEIPSNIDLGPDQIKALLESLSAEIALVYGRPGTGKSYLATKIIKVLAYNRENAGVGPTICIFHNDSALDRMVDRLLNDGIRGIVRMGGRSDSERLQSLDLTNTCYTRMRRQDKRDEKHISKFLDTLVSHIEGQFQLLSNIESPWELDRYLSLFDPDSRKKVFGPRRGDFSDYQPSTSNAVREWLAGDASLFEDDVPPFGAFQMEGTLIPFRRQDQHRLWLIYMRNRIIEELKMTYNMFETIRSHLRHFHDDARRQVLQNAHVVAVTTTELAKHPELLQPMKAKVLVCDDAGELLESQVLSAILPSTEHIILLGDHQLLPQVHTEKLQRTNREGALDPLDVSLFERLLDMKYDLCPRVTLSALSLQRRMRLSIARLNRLIRDTGLGNDDLVRAFPEVVGMRRPLFWLDHRRAAGSNQEEDFSLDDFDIEMVIAMVNHLVRQGCYRRNDIAVITPYGSQLRQLLTRLEMEDSFTTSIDGCDLEGLWEIKLKESQEQSSHSGSAFNGTAPGEVGAASLGSVRLATLDSFRGQEAKIVIITLGRCTSESALHSMRTSRRIDVLMSRAQHGCYILGDSDAYKEDPVWGLIISTLEAGGNLGNTLELRCPRDPGEVIRVSGPDEFKLASPHGGCTQPCGQQLDCGHECRCPCHSQIMHALTPCSEPCPRRKPGCEHACALTCGESCEGSCSEVMNDVHLNLPCGHVLGTARCWQVQTPAGVICEAEVDYKVPGCEHDVIVPCYETDPQNSSFRCPSECGAPLQCGHLCQRKCHECNFRYQDTFIKAIHDLCDQPCGKSRPDCAHSCQRTCHGDSECGPCQQPCDVRCSHGRCDKLCHEPCVPCTEDQCASGCPHSKCTMPCAAPCDWVPCSRRCTLLLECGHQCPSLCGEVCPESKYCQICGTDDILFTVVDSLDLKDYKDVNLDEDPCIFLRCGHFQTRSSMDQQLGIQDFYETTDDGLPSIIKGVIKPFSVEKISRCTQCKGALREIPRYGRIIRRPMLDKSVKEYMTWSNKKLLGMVYLLNKHESSLPRNRSYHYTPTSSGHQSLSIGLNGNMESQIHDLREFVGDGRYVDLANLYTDMQAFLREIDAKEKPFRKVADLTRRANENNNATARSTASIHLHEPFVQPQRGIFVMSLCLKCNIIILERFLILWKEDLTTGTSRRPSLEFDLTSNFRGSHELIKRAREANHPLLEALGHIYCAWFCGFARALGVEALTPTRELIPPLDRSSEISMPRFPSTDEELRERGLQYISKASDILATLQFSTMHPKDEMKATEFFIHQGRFDNEDAMQSWFSEAEEKCIGTKWYVCNNGHPFTNVRPNSNLRGRLFCTECGLIMEDQGGQASEEGAIVNVVLPSRDEVETLIDI